MGSHGERTHDGIDSNADAAVDADAELVAFAKAGRIARFPQPDAVLCMGDMEVRFEVVERDGRFELLRRERGGAPGLVVSSEALDVVRKVLIQRIGVNVRGQLRLRRVALPTSTAALPPGFVLDERDDAAELVWSDGEAVRSARFPPGATGAAEAVKLSRYARVSEHDLIAALLDPVGGQLFRLG